MRIKVDFPPAGFVKQETYGSESGARQYRKDFLRHNAGQYSSHRIEPDDVVIYYSGTDWGKGWEVWVRK